jgi:uncharacterized membrane protein YbhN (UPF0104 family)
MEEGKRMMKGKRGGDVKRWTKWSLSWLITGGIIFFLIHQVPFEKVIEATPLIELSNVGISALLSLFANIYVSTEKYRKILILFGADISLMEAIILKVGTIPLKTLLPLKAGEAVRMLYLKRVHRLPYFRAGLSILMNALFSLFSLFLIFSIGASIIGSPAISPFFIIFLPILILLFFVLFRRLSISMNRSGKRGGRLRGEIFEIIQIVSKKATWPSMARIGIYSVFLEGIKVINYWIIFKGMGIEISFDKLLFLVPGAIFASSLPTTVLGIGAREAAVLYLFSAISKPELLLGAGMMISMIEAIVPLFAGIILMKAFFNRLISPVEKGGNGSTGEIEGEMN